MAASYLVLYRNYTLNDNYYSDNSLGYRCGDNLPSINDLGILPPNGKRFKEWNWARDGSSTGYNAGEQSDYTHASYYIIWEDLPTYYKVLEEDLIAVADAINALTGNNGQLEWPDGFIEGVNLITFTIENVTYHALNGMTWGEWVPSKYNTTTLFTITNGVVQFSPRGYVAPPGTAGQVVSSSDVIQNNINYERYNGPS